MIFTISMFQRFLTIQAFQVSLQNVIKCKELPAFLVDSTKCSNDKIDNLTF